MLELIDGLPGNVVGIAVSGRLTRRDCEDLLVPAMQKCLRRHNKIRLYYELNSRFPGAAWEELDLGLEHVSRYERVAIVTDIAWVRLTVKALRFLIPSDIRVFAKTQGDEGRAWIRACQTDGEKIPSLATLRATARRAGQSPPARTRPRLARNEIQAPVENSGIIGRMELTSPSSGKFAPLA